MSECNSRPLAQGAGIEKSFSEVRLSMLAVAAAGLALLGVLLLPGYLWTFKKGGPPSLFTPHSYGWILLSVSLLSAILGLISAARIAMSGGRLTGRAFAWIGVGAPAVQALLFLVLVLPAVPRSRAFRMTCGTNLAGIGKSMLIYANDYEDQLPQAGGRHSAWAARIPDWKAPNRYAAYGLDPSGTGGQASISASLYLLVKYAEALPPSFVCTGEVKVTRFELAVLRGLPQDFALIDAWDFGPDPLRHVSYAYQQVYGSHRLTTDGNPGMAIAAERNPWMDSPFGKGGNFASFSPDIAPFGGTMQAALQGNARAHRGDGQNVLFLDSHVEFARRAFCAVDDDNIYTAWDGADKVRGQPAQFGSVPAGPTDSLLVNDPVVPKNP